MRLRACSGAGPRADEACFTDYFSGGIGAAITGGIWTNEVFDKLTRYLGDSALATSAYSDPISFSIEFAMGTPERSALNRAHDETQVRAFACPSLCRQLMRASLLAAPDGHRGDGNGRSHVHLCVLPREHRPARHNAATRARARRGGSHRQEGVMFIARGSRTLEEDPCMPKRLDRSCELSVLRTQLGQTYLITAHASPSDSDSARGA